MDAPSQRGGPPRRPRFLVTAGNTRERIDAVRDWGNVFTGTTGFEIAKALSAAGEVDLVTSNRSHLEWLLHASPAGVGPVRGTAFTTHEELKVALAAQMGRGQCDAVFMTAAVADYRPERVFEVLQRRADPAGGQGVETWTVRDVQAGKVKSHFGQIAVLGGRTEKLVDLFRTAWGHRGLLVKFKLEVEIARDELLRVAEASRRASNADYLVANTLDMVQGPGAGAYLLGEGGHEWVPRPDLPARMLALARSALAPPARGRT